VQEPGNTSVKRKHRRPGVGRVIIISGRAADISDLTEPSGTGAVAEKALITLATPGLFNDVLCKNWPREFDLLIRKVSPAGLDGLLSGIKRSYKDVHGVRIKGRRALRERGGRCALRRPPGSARLY
jgi:hypothetical protein